MTIDSTKKWWWDSSMACHWLIRE